MEIICYGCGRGENPENTIEAIRHCQKTNPNWRIEMDLQITKDGEIILFHDYNAKLITGANENIFDLNLNEITALNAGKNFKVNDGYPHRDNPIRIPTLIEVFRLFPKAKFILDIHTNNLEAVDKIINIVDKFKVVSQIVVVSQYDKTIARFKEKRPDWKYGAATNEVKKMVYSSFIYLDNFFPVQSDILLIPVKFGSFTLLTRRVIKHINQRNKKLWVWMYEGKKVITVESKKEFERLKQKNIHGIFTDFPNKLNNEIAMTK